MLGIYDLPAPDPRPTDTPKRFIIDYFRAYQPEGGYPAP